MATDNNTEEFVELTAEEVNALSPLARLEYEKSKLMAKQNEAEKKLQEKYNKTLQQSVKKMLDAKKKLETTEAKMDKCIADWEKLNANKPNLEAAVKIATKAVQELREVKGDAFVDGLINELVAPKAPVAKAKVKFIA